MGHPVPEYVAKQYEGGARGFRAEKRRQLRALEKAYIELRIGCAFFPGGQNSMDDIEVALNELQTALSVKNWGK